MFSPEQENHDLDLEDIIWYLVEHKCVVEKTGYEITHEPTTKYYDLQTQKEKSSPDLHVFSPNGKQFYLEYKTGYTFEAFQYSCILESNKIIFYVFKENGRKYLFKPTYNILFPMINYHDHPDWLNNEGLPHNHQYLTEHLKINKFNKKDRNYGSSRSNDPYVWLNDKNTCIEFETWFLDHLLFHSTK